MSFAEGLSPRAAALQVAAFSLLVLALVPLGDLLSKTGLFASRGAASVITSVLLHALILTGAVALLLALARQRWSTLGLGRESPLLVLAFGMLGVVMAYAANTIAVIGYIAITRPDLERLGQSKMQALDPLATIPVAALLPIALVVGIYEEIAFRGLLLSRLRAALRARLPASAAAILAVLLSSAIFAFGHAYQGVTGIVQTAAAGIAFAVLALWRKSIWPCIFAHVAIDSFGLIALRVLKPALESMLPK